MPKKAIGYVAVAVLPNRKQIDAQNSNKIPIATPLNKYNRHFYPQVSEQLTLLIKQARLNKIRNQ